MEMLGYLLDLVSALIDLSEILNQRVALIFLLCNIYLGHRS